LSRLELPRITLKTGKVLGISQGIHGQEDLTDTFTRPIGQGIN